ncbi:MAG: cyclase family protein [bacterium]|nr:cyclase family protein [bacterium]
MLPTVSRIVDLSHPMYSNMPNIGGQVTFFPLDDHAYLSQITGGRMAMESRMILMPEHCGTHLDAPRHCDADGLSVDQVPLEQLVLPGHLLDLRHRQNGEAITIADLEDAERKSSHRIGPDAACVVWTGTSKDWGKDGFAMNRPFVPVDTAQWLVDRGIRLLCTDLIGMDDPSEWWWPTHAVWNTQGVCMVQQLCNLEALEGEDFLFVCLPLSMKDGTGCPVRAVAMIFEQDERAAS